MKVTLTIDVPDMLAPTIANALDKIADELSDCGYTDGEWDTTRASNNEQRGGDTVKFRIDHNG